MIAYRVGAVWYTPIVKEGKPKGVVKDLATI